MVWGHLHCECHFVLSEGIIKDTPSSLCLLLQCAALLVLLVNLMLWWVSLLLLSSQGQFVFYWFYILLFLYQCKTSNFHVSCFFKRVFCKLYAMKVIQSSLSWSFMLDVLVGVFGFSVHWWWWITTLLSMGSSCVLLNGWHGRPILNMCWGLRRGFHSCSSSPWRCLAGYIFSMANTDGVLGLMETI